MRTEEEYPVDVMPTIDLAQETIWLFLLAVLAFLIAAFATVLVLFRRSVPPAALLGGPLLTVVGTWLMSRLTLDPAAMASVEAAEAVVVGHGTTLVAGALFAMPTFGVTAVGLAIAGPRARPWDTPAALGLLALGLSTAALVGMGAASSSGNVTFASVRGVSYLLLTVLVVLAAFESARSDDEGPRGVGAAAAVLPVLWIGLAETAHWGFGHVFAPNQPQTLAAEYCTERWPQAVEWLLAQMRAELAWSRGAFAAAGLMALFGAVKELRLRGDVVFAVVALVAILTSGGLWLTAEIDQGYLLALSGLCPDL